MRVQLQRLLKPDSRTEMAGGLVRCYQASAPKVQSEGHARAIVGHVAVKMAQGRRQSENLPVLLILFVVCFLLGD